MKSTLVYLLSFIFVLGPYSTSLAQDSRVEFERSNLVGVDETTEQFIDAINSENASGLSRTSSTSSSSNSSATKCAPGEIYNSFSKKCMGTKESRKLAAEADQECNVLTDPKLRTRCAASQVEGKIARAEENGDMGEHSNSASKISLLPLLLSFATLYAAIDHMTTKTSNCPGSESSYLMIGGAVSLIATEVMTKTTFSKELKKAQKDLEAIVNGSKGENSDNKNATDLQVEIFDALIKRENGVIKAAEGKKKGYNLAKLMFIGATIAAGLEAAKFTSMSAYPPTAAAAVTLYICADATASNYHLNSEEAQLYSYIDYLQKTNSKEDYNQYIKNSNALNLTSVENFQAQAVDSYKYVAGDFSSLNVDEYENIKAKRSSPKHNKDILANAFNILRNQLLPDAHALPILALPAAVSAIMTPEKVKGFKKFYLSPYSRLTLSGIMTAVTFTLTGHADKEIKKAKKRIEVLEKLKGQVSEKGPTTKCANGNEQGDKGCEQVTPTTVKPGESSFSLAATNPNGSANTNRGRSFADAKGCATSKGQADPDCNCKKTNSCFSMNSNFKIGDSAAGDILGNGINDINALTNGNLSPAGLDGASLNKQLAAAGKIKDKVLSNINKDPKMSAELKKAQEALNGFQRQMFNSMPANASGLANSLSLSPGSDFSGLSGNQVLDQVKEELKESSAPTVTNEAVAGSGSSDFNFDLGTADPMNVGTGLTEGEAQGNMNINDFELAESEINPSSSTNIFEILSSRYKKSAFRRLLKADKEIAPEAPAEKEIND